jgi:hypothetical protein
LTSLAVGLAGAAVSLLAENVAGSILVFVFDWIKRFRKAASKLTLPAREERGGRNTEALDLKPYTPDAKTYLGQLAYLQLSQFEILTNELKYSPNTRYQAELSEAAAKSFEKYRVIAKRIAQAGLDATDAMDPFVERIETFHSLTAPTDWHESIIKVYLVSGLLDDFYARLAVGLDVGARTEITRVLGDKTFEDFAKRVLLESISNDDQLASRMALYGRRLMGDVLLELRAVLSDRKLAGIPESKSLSEEQEREVKLAAYTKLEPLITELIGAHSVRMDALGLTA